MEKGVADVEWRTARLRNGLIASEIGYKPEKSLA